MAIPKRILSTVLCLCLLCMAMLIVMRASAATTADLPVTISTTGKTYSYTKSGTNFTELQYGTASSTATAGTITSASVDNGGVKFTIDTTSNKYFKLYYKEIPVTINVPANTEFSVEFSYDFDGQHIRSNKNATANVSAMIVYQGAESASDKIKFYPISEASASAYTTINGTKADKVFGTGITYSGGATESKTVNMYSVSGETYTAKFTNNTSSAANITRYFGYWVACDYGSSYANRAVTNFTLTPKAINYTVNFDADGGTVDTKSKAVSVGSTYGELPVPKLECRAFNGWYTERNGGGREITSTTTVEATDGSTLYALWTDGPYINWQTEETIEYGQKASAGFGGISVSINKNRYLFEWYQCDDKNGTNDRKIAETIYDGDWEDSLYKTPTDLPVGTYYYYTVYTITEFSTGKSIYITGPVSAVIVEKATPVGDQYPNDIYINLDTDSNRLCDYNIPDCTMKNKDSGASVSGKFEWANPDMIFEPTTGWDTIKVDMIFTPDDLKNYNPTTIQVKMEVTHTHKFTIDGDVIKAPTCTTAGSMYKICSVCGSQKKVNVPATGHDYENGAWLYNETQHWKQCANCDTTDTPADHTFGEWNGGKRNCTECGYEQIKTIAITFDADGGTVSTKSKNVTFGSTYGELPVPVREGYAFGGWYTKEDGKGTEIISTTEVTATDDFILYALWIREADPAWVTDKTIEYGQQITVGFDEFQPDTDNYDYLFEWYKYSDMNMTKAEKVGSSTHTSKISEPMYQTPSDLSVGTHCYYVVITTTLNEAPFKSTSVTGPAVMITVERTTPNVYNNDYPKTSVDLTVSMRLGDFDIIGGSMMNPHTKALVPGTFSWLDGDTKITSTGTHLLYVLFTPDDQKNYKPTSFSISVDVECSHNFIDDRVVNIPTCTTPGSKNQKCSVCGATKTVSIPATGHDYENGAWLYNEAQHWKQCANCDTTDTPADHIFGEWNGGKRNCEICGYEDIQLITITITWSELTFTYTDGVWNPETHDYSLGEWTTDSTDGNMITVENQGSGEVSVYFIYTQVNDSVDGSFADDRDIAIENPVALSAGDKKYIRLHLSGKPNKYMNVETVGTVTVRLGGNT